MEFTVHFAVRCPAIRDWEFVHVVGNLPILGDWQPKKSYRLKQNPEDKELWKGSIKVPTSVKDIFFRYAKFFDLDSADNNKDEPIPIISKWETISSPRHCLLECESTKCVARENTVDQFGEYGGRTEISDGWIIHLKEQVVYFRIHGEALKIYDKKYSNAELRLKVVPFDVRFSDVLTREDPIFGDQYENGSVFRNNIDYLVFRTRTVSIQNLGFCINVYRDGKLWSSAYALPSTFPNTHGASIFPFLNNSKPVGTLTVDYMIAKRSPAAETNPTIDDMSVTFGRYWRKRKRILEIGHRGMGSSYTKNTSARENTVFSMNQAAQRGADYVELDVQLTKDLKTVVYHDFHLLVTVSGRDSPTKSPSNAENKSLHEIPIKDLTFNQLNLLHFEHISKANPTDDNVTLSVTPGKDDTDKKHDPFPSLATVLTTVDKNVGLNIEIKYPMYMKDGSHECQGYFEQNMFVDIILGEVAQYAGDRRIIFSCFEPDICTLITQKQHKYPVLFLVVGATNRYMPFQDIRSDSSKIAANFAAGCELLGVNFHSEELLNDRNPIAIADKYKLVKFVWGDDLNSKEIQKLFKEEMNIDGIIFDRIGEDETLKSNVFILEKEHRKSLFTKNGSKSPNVNRRCMSMATDH
ncbi:unnamed protein product [Caenorhabditis bovis]|uniref:GP-PDE domain-containing protein n=1 Tax=Caenorhabditis bovis TaxID=2654633 RepID=A0A8S1EDF7_9PELO|nr:unnamed protein product [Caenorhabditis bovis]